MLLNPDRSTAATVFASATAEAVSTNSFIVSNFAICKCNATRESSLIANLSEELFE
jgi:hypothetical protein